jgi:hypothetical protein
MATSCLPGHSGAMYRRALSTILWFVAAWEVGAALELVAGFGVGVVAPSLAVLAALAAALYPFKAIRAQTRGAEQTPGTTA